MNIYDKKDEFSGEVAAKLIAFGEDGNGNADTFGLVLQTMKDDYLSAMNYCKGIQASDEPGKWLSRPKWPVERCERLLEMDPKGGSFAGWLAHRPTSFEDQVFDRAEISRWIAATSLDSEYQFSITPADKNGMKWTPEKMAELRLFRSKHTMPETAAHFRVSESRIRKLDPREKPKPKGHSVFTHRPK
jgi:hypothetical protein